jgi:hypothetical protein
MRSTANREEQEKLERYGEKHTERAVSRACSSECAMCVMGFEHVVKFSMDCFTTL